MCLQEDKRRKGSLSTVELKSALESPPLSLRMSSESLEAVAWRFRWRGEQGREIDVDIDALVEFVLEEAGDDGDDSVGSDSDSGDECKSTSNEDGKMGDSKEDGGYMDAGESKGGENIRGKRHRSKVNKKSAWRVSKLAPPIDPEPSAMHELSDDWPLDTLCSFELFTSCRRLALDKCERNGLRALQLASMRGYSRTVQALIHLGASRESSQVAKKGDSEWPDNVSALELTDDKEVIRALLKGGIKELQELTHSAHQRLRQRPEEVEELAVKKGDGLSWLKSLSLCSDPGSLLAELSDPMMRSPLHFAAIAGLEVARLF